MLGEFLRVRTVWLDGTPEGTDVTTLKDLSNDSPQYFDGFTLFRVALVAEDEEGTH